MKVVAASIFTEAGVRWTVALGVVVFLLGSLEVLSKTAARLHTRVRLNFGHRSEHPANPRSVSVSESGHVGEFWTTVPAGSPIVSRLSFVSNAAVWPPGFKAPSQFSPGRLGTLPSTSVSTRPASHPAASAAVRLRFPNARTEPRERLSHLANLTHRPPSHFRRENWDVPLLSPRDPRPGRPSQLTSPDRHPHGALFILTGTLPVSTRDNQTIFYIVWDSGTIETWQNRRKRRPVGGVSRRSRAAEYSNRQPGKFSWDSGTWDKTETDGTIRPNTEKAATLLA